MTGKRVALLAACFLPAIPSMAAQIVDGAIVRGEETLRAIDRTRPVVLRRDARSRDLLVSKSRYCLEALEDGRLAKVFPVAFGGVPTGHKERQGDNRTPEGRYVLVPHHQSPSFGACFYVCYPSAEDARLALRRGLIGRAVHDRILAALGRRERPPADTPLGGLILLHGTKDRTLSGLTDTNWTLGCIVMENEDLLKLLAVYSSRDRPVLSIEP